MNKVPCAWPAKHRPIWRSALRALSHQPLFAVRTPSVSPGNEESAGLAVYASDGTRVLVEVKTIFNPPPMHSGVGYHDPYPPIRNHLGEAFKQFTDLPDSLNVIALAAFPGSFVDLSSPHIMLGAMYGDTSFQFPIDTETGKGNSEAGTNVFVQGKGPMIG